MLRMTRDQARLYVKEHIEDYLSWKGIDTRREFTCLNPEHHDSHPSMTLWRQKHRVKCFPCGASYDTFDLIAIDYHLDTKAAMEKGYELFGIEIIDTPRRSTPEEDFSDMESQNNAKTGQNTDTHTHTDTAIAAEENKLDYFRECAGRLTLTEYRGLSRETLERHMVGYDPQFRTRDHEKNYVQWEGIIIPTGRGSYTVRNLAQDAHKKDRYRKRGAAQIFGYKSLYSSASPVFVVEGEIDAMSIEEAGGAAVGLGSYDNVPLLLKMCENRKPSQPLIIAFDNESEPDKQAEVAKHEEELAQGLQRLEIPFYRLSPYGEYKDANAALVGDRESFSATIRGAANMELQAEEAEREAYLSTSNAAYMQQFINGIAESVNTEAIPTGFSELDKALDGGLYEGLLVVGAISSLGKTTLAMQVADQVAAAGNDVLIISLEMARKQLMSKSISRHTLQLSMERKLDTRNAKTSRGITNGKRWENYSRTELSLIHDAMGAYNQYAERIYIREGVGDITVDRIREAVQKHILFTGGKWITDATTGERTLEGGRRPLVIVDYLQIIAPHSDRATDKQRVDHAVLELKRISRDYRLPIIAISSFNREGYKESVSFENLKESGAIEYSADIVIGLQLEGAGKKDFNPTEAKKKDPRKVEAVILKNREGRVGDKILFSYYPMFNYFHEEGNIA